MNAAVRKLLSHAAPGGRLHRFAKARTRLARTVLLLFALLVACPVRYWPLEDDVDPAWRFALNYAPNHGYAMGRDYVYTSGPLGYLIFPQNVGNNLAHALLFQGCLWLVIGAILADVFFHFRLRNLVVFSVLFSLTSPWFWVNSAGPENIILACALLLLVMFRLRGGWPRYGIALLLIGFLPLFRISAGVIGGLAMAGLLAERLLAGDRKALPELVLGALVPVSVFTGSCLLLLPSAAAFLKFLRASAEVTGGFTPAMSVAGPGVELFLAVLAAAILLIALRFQAGAARKLAKFYILLLAGPFLISVKHGFVRHDEHVVNFFCFIAFALAMVSLTMAFGGAGGRRMLMLLVVFAAIWADVMNGQYGWQVITRATGVDGAAMVAGALRFEGLQRSLDTSVAEYPRESRLEPGIIAAIGDSPVASLSEDFTNVAAAGLHLALYPTVQRFTAYTPFLDQWNAEWIREKGPRFIVYDGDTIDDRDLWAETPAMWLEVYRWYDARLLAPGNLLLERRSSPRFGALASLGRFRVGLPGELRIPSSPSPVFWTMTCEYSGAGLFRKTFARMPPVTMTAHEAGGKTHGAHRVVPEVLASPVLGTYSPEDLTQFAAIFTPGADAGPPVDRIRIDGDGTTSYASPCDVELLRPLP